jgi:hypothetical protein
MCPIRKIKVISEIDSNEKSLKKTSGYVSHTDKILSWEDAK